MDSSHPPILLDQHFLVAPSHLSPGALLMGPDASFITGSDILMDGGVTAAYWYGELAPQ
jgi:hypothetical protein